MSNHSQLNANCILCVIINHDASQEFCVIYSFQIIAKACTSRIM